VTFATVNGQRIIRGSIVTPAYGMWSADLFLANDQDLGPGQVAVSVGNLSLMGSIYRQATFAGARWVRLVAGAGGWRNNVATKQYSLQSGVSMRMVLTDAATEVGELMGFVPPVTVGSQFCREAAKATRVLKQLAGTAWYVDLLGVTQIQARPASAILSPFQVIDLFGGEGRASIATEDYAAWVPNATFTSPFLGATYQIHATRLHLSPEGEVRVEVLTS
jgi:hypothetical protein